MVRIPPNQTIEVALASYQVSPSTGLAAANCNATRICEAKHGTLLPAFYCVSLDDQQHAPRRRLRRCCHRFRVDAHLRDILIRRPLEFSIGFKVYDGPAI